MTHHPHPASPDASSTAPFDPAHPNGRFDGWTPLRQFDFIEALAQSGCVTEAARSVGMTPQSAYKLRQRGDAVPFAIAWEQALTHAVHRLADAALSRALHGVATPIFYKGEQIGERRSYDENLTRFLLRLRVPERYKDLPPNMTVDRIGYAGVDFDLAKERLLDPNVPLPGHDQDPGDEESNDFAGDGSETS